MVCDVYLALCYYFHFSLFFYFFFFNDTATTEIYTLSLHDALPISPLTDPRGRVVPVHHGFATCGRGLPASGGNTGDRKSTRLNSSHLGISYAVFCLKKKKKKKNKYTTKTTNNSNNSKEIEYEQLRS